MCLFPFRGFLCDAGFVIHVFLSRGVGVGGGGGALQSHSGFSIFYFQLNKTCRIFLCTNRPQESPAFPRRPKELAISSYCNCIHHPIVIVLLLYYYYYIILLLLLFWSLLLLVLSPLLLLLYLLLSLSLSLSLS